MACRSVAKATDRSKSTYQYAVVTLRDSDHVSETHCQFTRNHLPLAKAIRELASSEILIAGFVDCCPWLSTSIDGRRSLLSGS